MPQLLDLPNELFFPIIEYLVPYNEHRPIVGFNAGWRTLDDYRRSLKGKPVAENKDSIMDNEGNQNISLYQSLLALRSTCSLFRELCFPALIEDFNVFRPANELPECLSKQMHHARTVRLLLDVLSDEDAAKIIRSCENATSISFYHYDFEPEEYDDRDTFWMDQINQSVLLRLEQGRLDSLGFYSCTVLDDKDERSLITSNDLEGPLPLLEAISKSKRASVALKHLDMSIYTLQSTAYSIIRTALPSLESLSFNYALRPPLMDLTYSPQFRWTNYSNLERLQFKICERVYAGHISSLVRYFPALKYIMISTCGSRFDQRFPGLPENWYSAEDALWKSHRTLDAIHIEHMYDWEIRAMADIPVKTLIITNVRGDFFNTVLEEDPKHFPGLRTIRIQGQIPEYTDGKHPFEEEHLSNLQTICKKRALELRRDAKGMMLFPRHYY